MGDVLGIIAEYNPFHNGHLYHLQKAKELSGAKYVVCIMSGNYVQRGNTSIIDKWKKTQIALENGVDLVIELPTIYSVSSAEMFASGAVKLLNELKIIDTISFGAETSDFNVLNDIANILVNEPKEFVRILKEELNQGNSYPKARENALIKYINNDEKYVNILNNPNNILGIEYLKSLKKIKSKINTEIVKREKVQYNDNKVVEDFASATAIRNFITNNEFKEVAKVVPQNCYNMLINEYEQGNVVCDIKKYEKEIFYILRRMSIKEIADLPDVTEGLEYSIKTAVSSCNNIETLIDTVKSKRYTQTRIQRILIFALLGITKKDVEMAKKVTPYARILGFNNNGKMLLSSIAHNNPKMKVITSVKKFTDTNTNKTYKRMMDIDILATDVYTLGYKNNSLANMDYTKNMIIINK